MNHDVAVFLEKGAVEGLRTGAAAADNLSAEATATMRVLLVLFVVSCEVLPQIQAEQIAAE
jgi:hypothetical protein